MDFRNKWQKKRNLYKKPQTDTISIILIVYEEKCPFPFGQKVNCKYYICRETKRRNHMIDADETSRYKKRTDSDVSKSKNKSKHKHQYADVLISVGPSNSLYTGRVCAVCGKIKDLGLATGRIEIDGKICCRMLTDEETREKYKDLKEYHIDNLLQKYVKLEEHDGTIN